MWLPMYSLTPDNYRMVLAAFADAFSNAAVWYEPSELNSFTVVTAGGGDGPWRAETLAAAFADPAVGGELASLGLAGPADVLACQMLSGAPLEEWLAGVPPHEDDLPAVEYESGSLLERNWTWLATFDALLERRPATPPAAWLAALSVEEQARADERWEAYRGLMAAHRDYLRRQLLGGAGGAPAVPAGVPEPEAAGGASDPAPATGGAPAAPAGIPEPGDAGGGGAPGGAAGGPAGGVTGASAGDPEPGAEGAGGSPGAPNAPGGAGGTTR
jgi:hypothetical protein